MTVARSAFPITRCVYAQADHEGHVVRIGKASKGLTARDRGGTGWALDAATHGSKNLVFAAEAEQAVSEAMESCLRAP